MNLSKTHEKATLYAPKGATWLIIWGNVNPIDELKDKVMQLQTQLIE